MVIEFPFVILNYRNLNPKMEVIVPGINLSEVSKILPGEAKDTINLYLTDKHILFEFGKTKVVSRLLEW